ncbi:GNAT family N-acetyltransferase [Acinetobacter sp. ANC 3791]|uniref:GNAT family N-acetyltransferase n=1 Tax=Acinetobacter sp. ANC 3791 TaxID=2529836 RepID=UPI00103B58DE|nr:GNAT family protein [Acinetobacter sp. ANC 3791]TCB85692.1 N-acetyltransferase [Acinetobacter sp. ANC 3791]
MNWLAAAPTLEHNNIRLKPLSIEHLQGLIAATKDGELWNIRVTSTPHPDQVAAYIEHALQQREQQLRQAFAVINTQTGKVLGTTSYHDIVPNIQRLEIGYTWYAASVQRTQVNTTCKFLLLRHAFEDLGAQLVGFRTDNFNYRSQRAIERLGAKKDGVLRHHQPRKDGTVRDTVMYSIRAGEWAEIKAHLQDLLQTVY